MFFRLLSAFFLFFKYKNIHLNFHSQLKFSFKLFIKSSHRKFFSLFNFNKLVKDNPKVYCRIKEVKQWITIESQPNKHIQRTDVEKKKSFYRFGWMEYGATYTILSLKMCNGFWYIEFGDKNFFSHILFLHSFTFLDL